MKKLTLLSAPSSERVSKLLALEVFGDSLPKICRQSLNNIEDLTVSSGIQLSEKVQNELGRLKHYRGLAANLPVKSCRSLISIQLLGTSKVDYAFRLVQTRSFHNLKEFWTNSYLSPGQILSLCKFLPKLTSLRIGKKTSLKPPRNNPFLTESETDGVVESVEAIDDWSLRELLTWCPSLMELKGTVARVPTTLPILGQIT